VRHDHTVQLRWSDPDMLGHVNHARALALLEDARLAMVDGRAGGSLILARLEVDYLRQLYYRVGEQLAVSSWVTRLGTRSLTLRQELVQDGEVAIRADVVMVQFDYETDASRAMTDDERAHWSRYLEG
jgi:acyl-CoA thioester hydrolase